MCSAPLPTATPQPGEILRTGLADASCYGEIALDYLGEKTFQGSEDNFKLRILNDWSRSENIKCKQIWVDTDAKDRFINELVQFTFIVSKITVEMQSLYNRIVMKTWIPQDDVLQLLRESCRESL